MTDFDLTDLAQKMRIWPSIDVWYLSEKPYEGKDRGWFPIADDPDDPNDPCEIIATAERGGNGR